MGCGQAKQGSSPGDSPGACQRLTWPQRERDLGRTERWSPNKERVGITPVDLALSLPALQGQGLPPQGSWAAEPIVPLHCCLQFFSTAFDIKPFRAQRMSTTFMLKGNHFATSGAFSLLFLKSLCFHSVGWRSSLQLCAQPLNFLPTLFFSYCFQPCH